MRFVACYIYSIKPHPNFALYCQFTFANMADFKGRYLKYAPDNMPTWIEYRLINPARVRGNAQYTGKCELRYIPPALFTDLSTACAKGDLANKHCSALPSERGGVSCHLNTETNKRLGTPGWGRPPRTLNNVAPSKSIHLEGFLI